MEIDRDTDIRTVHMRRDGVECDYTDLEMSVIVIWCLGFCCVCSVIPKVCEFVFKSI